MVEAKIVTLPDVVLNVFRGNKTIIKQEGQKIVKGDSFYTSLYMQVKWPFRLEAMYLWCNTQSNNCELCTERYT